MSLDTDAIIDRGKLKRRLSAWRLVAIIAVAGAALAWIARDEGVIPRDHVARISIDGLITEDTARERALARVAEDTHARALIVTINSPGGTVVGGENLYRALRRVAEKKPVVAVMGTVAASGGYMTAIGADRIFARAGTLTGSIGVILQSADVTGLLKKLGVEPEVIKSSPLKAVPNPLEPLTEEGRAATRAVVMDMYEQFVAMVAERRKLDPAAARNLADGRVYTGRQAVDRRLIDAIGGEIEARDWLAQTHKVAKSLPVRQIHVRDETGELLGLAGRIVGKTLFSERLTLDGLVSVWHPDLN
ncbi:MAG: signal peptide peptidase SppA [Alphaproteobacteria bacterium]|nr:signal peptide peptidase SppA [Alphaproteobacteria bacterium]